MSGEESGSAIIYFLLSFSALFPPLMISVRFASQGSAFLIENGMQIIYLYDTSCRTKVPRFLISGFATHGISEDLQ